MDILLRWSRFFDENDVENDQKILLIDYIDKLHKKNLPIIFEYNHLANLIGFESYDLSKYTICTKKSYRTFRIPKRKNGFREIKSPYPVLAHCQRWIYENILKNVDMGEHAYAFVKNRSIVDNAKVHINSREILKIDIVDFFGSIRIERVISIFKRMGYTNLVSFHLASICCYDKCLPQGACTSPAISNIIAKRLDRRIYALSKKLNLNYSRYADDITLSGDYVPRNIIKYLSIILKDEGFSINKDKIILKKEGEKKIITGLSVFGDKVRVSKTYRRQFRKDVYYLLKNSFSEYNGTNGLFDPLYLNRMIGKANFILSVEPNNTYVLNALKKMINMKKDVLLGDSVKK